MIEEWTGKGQEEKSKDDYARGEERKGCEVNVKRECRCKETGVVVFFFFQAEDGKQDHA